MHILLGAIFLGAYYAAVFAWTRKIALRKNRDTDVWTYLAIFFGVFAPVTLLVLSARAPEPTPEGLS